MGSLKQKPVIERSIDYLAFQHVNVHPNDKCGGIRAKMIRRYGKTETDAAINRAKKAKILLEGK